ncbi:hypothetical protein Tco_0931968 [Tanacetum coccineum]
MDEVMVVFPSIHIKTLGNIMVTIFYLTIDLIDEAEEARELEKELRQITKEKNEAVCYVHTTHTLTSRQAYNGQSSKLKVMRRGETEIFCRYTDNRPKQPLWSTSTNLICWPDPGFVHTGFLKGLRPN